MFGNEVEVGIIEGESGKRIYVLVKYKNLQSNYGSRVAICDKNGKPKMWTRKADMIAYAKKNGLYIEPGYNVIGGGGTGVKWM